MLCYNEKTFTCSSVRQLRIQWKTSKSVERLLNDQLALQEERISMFNDPKGGWDVEPKPDESNVFMDQ